MQTWLAVVSGLMAVLYAAVTAGRRHFRALVAADVKTLCAEETTGVGPEQLRRRWEALPEPVRRYFRYAVPAQSAVVRAVHLRHDGVMRMSPGGRWFRVDGEERLTVSAPGFVWSARMWLAPLIWIEARDCVLAGRGGMLVKLYSLMTLVDARGPEIDQGSRMRWLAEAVWSPYAFVGDDVLWEPIDGGSARATLRTQGLAVSAVVDIDDEGKVSGVRGVRYRDVGHGKAVLTPWFARCADYRAFEGFHVPTIVEVGWVLGAGEFIAFRFRVTALDCS